MSVRIGQVDEIETNLNVLADGRWLGFLTVDGAEGWADQLQDPARPRASAMRSRLFSVPTLVAERANP